jgi:sensor histidine kinase YesM
MAKTNDHFGQLLKAGMASIALIEHKNANVIEDEFSTLQKFNDIKKAKFPQNIALSKSWQSNA